MGQRLLALQDLPAIRAAKLLAKRSGVRAVLCRFRCPFGICSNLAQLDRTRSDDRNQFARRNYLLLASAKISDLCLSWCFNLYRMLRIQFLSSFELFV